MLNMVIPHNMILVMQNVYCAVLFAFKSNQQVLMRNLGKITIDCGEEPLETSGNYHRFLRKLVCDCT